ncbi:MAG: hypothetical protein Q4C48_10850 [Lachnospiraceae bacterium]|nr:hypothetical protein [Lachnospiraceae bacterium]
MKQTHWRPRLYIDMDGTLAKWQSVQRPEDLYEPGFFARMQPQEVVVSAVCWLIRTGDMEVYILSTVLSDSPYARSEKLGWLRQHLPELPYNHVLFAPCGTCKAEYVPGGVQRDDLLLDDCTNNLREWPGLGIKLLDGVNHTHQSWRGICVRADLALEEFLRALWEAAAIADGAAHLEDLDAGGEEAPELEKGMGHGRRKK